MLLSPLLRVTASRWSVYLLRTAPAVRQGSKHYSQAIRTADAINLAVGGNGEVKLDISLPSGTVKNEILLYLPPGPFSKASLASQTMTLAPTFLQDSLPNCTIITINYRLGPRLASIDHRFPAPIHDVFKAWDYVIDPESPHNNVFGRDGSEYLEPTVSLYGSHIGGALALTLALTNPQEIHALAIEDPLVDWTILDEFAAYQEAASAQQSNRRSKSWLQSSEYLRDRSEAAKALIKLRTDLFRTPSGYFDSFASPTLFLRAPGRDTPLTRTAAPVTSEVDEFTTFEGEEIRYGDDEDEIGWLESDETHNAFGPYDDDYHGILAKDAPSLEASDFRVDDSAMSASQETTNPEELTLTQQLTDLSLWTSNKRTGTGKPTTQRRKVLRRWPPNMQPGEVMLPYVQIYLRKPHPQPRADENVIDLSTVTYTEGAELQELLRRACFWGREKGVSEQRVNTILIEIQAESTSDNGVARWLQTKFLEA